MQVVRLLQQSRHHGVATAQAAAALEECAAVHDALIAAQMMHLQAGSFAALGDTAAALNAQRTALQIYTRLGVASDERVWQLWLDRAAVCERVGLRADAGEGWVKALEAQRCWLHQLGLAEMVVSCGFLGGEGVGVMQFTSTGLIKVPHISASNLCIANHQTQHTQEHPELTATTLTGASAYVATLLHTARTVTRRRRFDEAESALRAAAALLPYTRASPLLHAAVWTELARTLRLAAAMKLPFVTAAAAAGSVGALAARIRGQRAPSLIGSGSTQSAATRLSEAQSHLLRAIGILALDATGHNQPLQRCLLELAACSIAAKAPGRAAAALRLANAAASKHQVLQLFSAQLVPAAAGAVSLPHWLVEEMTSQEAYASQQQQHKPASTSNSTATKPADPTSPPPATATQSASALTAGSALTARLALSHLAWLQSDQSELAGESDKARCEAQLLAMTPSLRAACPKLGADCCFADVPIIPADQCPEPPAGSLMALWHVQDGCWQAPSSWQPGGAIAAARDVTAADVLAVVQPAEWASLLYVAGPSTQQQQQQQKVEGGSKIGTVVTAAEVAFELSAVRKMQRTVKDVCLRLERPGSATDLFLQPSPTESELAAAKHRMECVLEGIADDDAPPPPTRLPEVPEVPVPPSVGVVATSAAPAAAAAKGGGAQAAAGGAAGTAASKAAGGAGAPAQAAAARAEQPKVLDWRSLSTWSALAALLDADGGYCSSSSTHGGGLQAALAAWLVERLAKRARTAVM